MFIKKIIYNTYSDYMVLVDPDNNWHTRIDRMETVRKVEYHDPDKEKKASDLSGYKIIPGCPEV